MDNDKKFHFEIRQQEENTYCVVEVIDGEDVVFPQTQHSTRQQAEDWLRFVEKLVNKSKES